MTALTGTATLARFIVRRDRVRILVWVVAIAGLVALTVVSIKGLYPTQADIDQAAAASRDNAAAIVFNGPAQGLETVGGEVAFQSGTTSLIVVALMTLLMIGRLTRGEEESGRLELLRALPVGSRAPTAAAMLVVAGMNMAVGVLVTVTLLSLGLPAAGSLVFGASFALLGLVFVGITLVAAQLTENTRVTYGISGAVLGASFVVRAIGDIGHGRLSWLSPIGWAQKARPFAGEQWWPLLLMIVATAGFVAGASALAERRDLGGGLVPPRPGKPVAAQSLGRPLGLATRLQRGSLIGWSVGVVCLAAAYGSVANSIDDFVRDNKALADMLASVGGTSLMDSYLATSVRLVALMASGFAVQSALRLRSEETSLRAEPILATQVSRRRWAASHLTIAFGGSVIVLVVAGLGIGLGDAAVTHDFTVVPGLVGAALTYAPAMWLLIGLALALVGLAPRLVAIPWAFLGVCFVVGLLGDVLGIPDALRNVSPFEHVSRLPAADLSIVPLVALTVIAAALSVAGLAGLQRRDIG